VLLSNLFIYFVLYGVIALTALPAVRAGPVPAATMGLLAAFVLFWIIPKLTYEKRIYFNFVVTIDSFP